MASALPTVTCVTFAAIADAMIVRREISDREPPAQACGPAGPAVRLQNTSSLA